MKPGPKPQDDSQRIPSKRIAYAREYRRKWAAEQEKRCPCSRPKVATLDGCAICAVCLEIETRKVRKRAVVPNADATYSADAYPLHLPRSSHE